VYECVMTSAMLRLPLWMTQEDKRKRVRGVLEELDLTSCQHTLIGDDVVGIKGISGGQKRRTSLAVELVKDPLTIFADEPTSGRDSEVALSIIQTLKVLASKGRTVICTIHQPNSDITDLFDDFMLLAHGRMVFSGAWLDAVPWFSECDFPCPVRKNPTDYFMTIVKPKEVAARMADDFKLKRIKPGKEGGGASDLEAPLLHTSLIQTNIDAPGAEHVSWSDSWQRLLMQIFVLTLRVTRNW
jgi:ABC-type multidrug transport system ATPase subunit